jgi:hypothetical protein
VTINLGAVAAVATAPKTAGLGHSNGRPPLTEDRAQLLSHALVEDERDVPRQ